MVETALDPASERYRQFVLANTVLQSPPHVPEIKLHLADEAHDLWQRTEDELATIGLPPPFWAFAWAGGQGVARYIIDNPQTVENRSVLDFASGSGLIGIAAAMANAEHVLCCDIDPFAKPAIILNAAANEVKIDVRIADLIGSDEPWDTILAGDIFYDKPLADMIIPWFHKLAARGTEVIVGDPGRSYFPKGMLEPLAVYSVPVTRVLEDAEIKKTTVWRFPS
ncbi:methyltransferase [Phyllobacterium sp. SB3]|uniref:class I SAM-dependent methyltransferase n=1 Tax=Phyllobacterium sp. SB3 TaxID=3156073 RepID=UPI0032AF9023